MAEIGALTTAIPTVMFDGAALLCGKTPLIFNGVTIGTKEIQVSQPIVFDTNSSGLGPVRKELQFTNEPTPKVIAKEAFINPGLTIRAKNRTFVVPAIEDSKCIVLQNAESEIRFAGTLSEPVVVPSYAYMSDALGRGRNSPFIAHYSGQLPTLQMYTLDSEIVALDYELKIYSRCYSNWARGLLLKTTRKTRGSLVHNVAENEQVAIETLREMISETEFRRYIKYGFILVQGNSGKTYQIFRNQSHTKVWKNGKVIEEICVRIKNVNIPPTDSVIAFHAMIRIDEEEFRKSGNLYKMVA